MRESPYPSRLKSILRGTSFVVFAVIVAGCAASPKLADYPRREMDRPFTLPKGLATWSILEEYVQEQYRFADGKVTDRYTIGPVPLRWQQSLSDDWNLIWYPIPVAAAYQIRSDDSATTGLVFGYGLRISSAGYSSGSLGAQYFHRQKLSREFALEFSPSIAPWFPIGDRAKWDLQAAFSAGPFWQAGDFLSLRAGARSVLRRDSTTVISGDVFDSKGLEISTHDNWRVVFPLYVGLNWSFSRQWDFGSLLEYQKLGETDDYSNLHVDFEFRHYW